MKRYQLVPVLTVIIYMLSCTFAMASSKEWTCPNCGNVSAGNYCDYCGQKKESVGETADYLETTFSSSSGKIGDTTVQLKKGFDFVNTGSSQYNWDLALTAVTLSAQIYTNASGDHTEIILKELGYEDTFPFHFGISDYKSPVACFGYKRLGDGKNLFTAVVRGTESDLDKVTDFTDGTFSMFSESGDNVRDGLLQFMEDATGKSREEVKEEDNYFFFTGHSLGGAVANYLSIENTIMQYAHSDKEKIYTYTFESPHTCVNLWWTDPESQSNAFNYKVVGDAVTNYPVYIGATTYGKDIRIKVSELNNETFRSMFTDCEKDTVDEAVSEDGHGDKLGLHDTCLGLIYIMGENKNIAVDSSHFPDRGFRAVVTSECDKNNDGFLSEEEISETTNLTMPDSGIESLKGLEFFNKLQYMEIGSGGLSELDCSSLPLLEELWCGGCALSSLNVTGCENLRVLACDLNELTGLDVSDCSKLEELYCDNNKLEHLYIDNCIALSHVSCEYNNLSTLDIGGCPTIMDAFLYGVKENDEIPEPLLDILEIDDTAHPYVYYHGTKEADNEEWDYDSEFWIDPDVSIVY